MVRIHGTPEIREDMVRVGMGAADLRYRGEFKEWSVILPIRFNTCLLYTSCAGVVAELTGELKAWFEKYVDPAFDGSREPVCGRGQLTAHSFL